MTIESPDLERVPGLAKRASRRHLLQGALGATTLAVSPLRSATAQDAAPEASASAQIYVYPMPGSVTASPGTQISFRGDLPDAIGPIHVRASVSREHSGITVMHSDGQGFSWIPDVAFHPGEEVRVRTRLNVVNGEDGDFTFTCAEPRLRRSSGQSDDETIENDYYHFRSRPGLRPPRISTELYEGETAPGYLFLSPKRGGGRNGALLVDNDGEPIWFLPADVETHEIYDFRVMDYEGKPSLVWWQGISVSGQGSGHWVIADSAYEQLATIRIGNGFGGGDMHDFALTPENTAIAGAYSLIRWDLSDHGGLEDGTVVDCVIQEIDIPTGAVMSEWHSLERVGLEESYREIEEDEREADYDYFHYNSVAIDEDGHLLIGGRNTFAVYKVDRLTGDVIWRLGGKNSDFAMGEGTEVAWQHDARSLGNGEISIYDNGASPKVHDESRGLVVAIDTEEMTATLVREYLHPDKISAGSQGNMQTLPNENVLIGWGSEPIVSEFAADGTLLFDLRFRGEKQTYRAYRFEWTGRPTSGPHLFVEAAPNGGSTAFASWNGATEVAAWSVLIGDAAEALTPFGEPTPKSGFETEISIPETARFYAVAALDDRGATLGTSPAVEASSE